MEKLTELHAFKERRNIVLKGFDPVSAGGFTQVPNVLLNTTELTAQAKLVYAKLLSYAWNNDFVFPGQERLSAEIGTSKSTVNRGVLELRARGWLEIRRRGQGKTNIYVLKYRVRRKQEAVSHP